MISSAYCSPLVLNLQHKVPHQFHFPLESPGSGPFESEISTCAYLIWEHEGRPSGREQMHWEQARAQLIACREHDEWLAVWFSVLGGRSVESQVEARTKIAKSTTIRKGVLQKR